MLDLYSGVGLFAAALADRVGPSGAVAAVEGDARAVADARRNLHDLPGVQLHQGDVGRRLDDALAALPDGAVDVVVLDPPRAGAGRDVVARLCAAAPRAISYVACDPAALARDIRTAADHGYRLAALRAFDAVPDDAPRGVHRPARPTRGPGRLNLVPRPAGHPSLERRREAC